jgi:Secretion system C-terminal sorting domain
VSTRSPFEGTRSLPAPTPWGAFRSTDSGSSWAPVDFGSDVASVIAFAGDDSSFYAWAGRRSLYYSADDGQHWRLVDTALQGPWYPARASLFYHRGSLFAQRGEGIPSSTSAIYRSTDHGTTWVSVISDVVVDACAVQDSVLLVMGEGPAAHPTHAYLYQSSDNGSHWATVGGLFQYGGLEFAVHDGWLFSGGFGISRSSDHGASWMSAQEGYGTREVSCFAEAPGSLFVGSWTNGVHVSTDDGATWTPVNEGLPEPTGVTSLAIHDNTLFAGTSSGGVWRRPLSEMTTDVQNSELLLTSFVLDQNFPNPFNPSTTIRYGLPSKSAVQLAVFNTLGQQVAALQNGEQDAGYHEVKFDGSGLSSGVYFYRIEAGSFVQTRKLLLIR